MIFVKFFLILFHTPHSDILHLSVVTFRIYPHASSSLSPVSLYKLSISWTLFLVLQSQSIHCPSPPPLFPPPSSSSSSLPLYPSSSSSSILFSILFNLQHLCSTFKDWTTLSVSQVLVGLFEQLKKTSQKFESNLRRFKIVYEGDLCVPLSVSFIPILIHFLFSSPYFNCHLIDSLQILPAALSVTFNGVRITFNDVLLACCCSPYPSLCCPRYTLKYSPVTLADRWSWSGRCCTSRWPWTEAPWWHLGWTTCDERDGRREREGGKGGGG